MASQPSYRPLEPSAFFEDGRSARPLVPGTVARGALPDTPRLLTGRLRGADEARAAALVGAGPDPLGAAAQAAFNPAAEYAARFPFPVTEAVMVRGQQRYTIFCALCHDAAGTGAGTIVERGFTRPPSLITDLSRGFRLRGHNVLLRDAPVGYLFEVMTNGFGAMPSYAAQVPPADRWAIAAYVRALQLSQYARLADLPESERKQVLSQLQAEKAP